MILKSTAEGIVLKSLTKFYNKQEGSRLDELNKMIDFYEGNHKEYISKLIDRKDKENIPYTYTNLVKHIIRKKSMVYHTPPVRINKKSESENNKYQRLIRYKNLRMKTCERQARLMPFILVRPYLVRKNNEEYFKYQIVRLFHIFEDFKNIEYPSGIIYPIISLNKSTLWEYWDKENHFIIDNFGKKIKNQEDYGIIDTKNQYGELPFALLRFDDIIEDIYRGGASDLVDANEMIDLALTELNYEYRWQSFKQLYITAKGATNLMDTTVESGYNKIMKATGEDVNIGILDLQTQFVNNIEVIKFQMNLISMNYDVSLKWELTGSAQSGFALIVKNIDLLNSWQDDIEFCRIWEQEIFEKEKLVYETDTSNKLPASDLHIDFAEVRFPVSPDEKRAKWDWEFNHGISTPLDYLKSESPDTPEEDLKKRLEENAKLKSNINTIEKPKSLTFEERLGKANV